MERGAWSVERGAWFCRHVRRQEQVLPHDMVDTDRSLLIDIDRLAWTVAVVGSCNRSSATEFYMTIPICRIKRIVNNININISSRNNATGPSVKNDCSTDSFNKFQIDIF